VKRNGDTVLNNNSLLKSNGDEVVNAEKKILAMKQ
jgi:hypothetical protein